METMAKYVVGDKTYECFQLEGLLFSMADDGSFVMVDVAEGSVLELDSESSSDSDPATGTEVHYVDVCTDKEVMLLRVKVSVSPEGRRIVAVDRYL